MANVLDLDRDQLLRILQDSVVEIEFTKVDGTLRRLRCTRNFDLLPVEYKPVEIDPVSTSERPVSLTAIPVYDIDLKAWRSFRVDALTSIELLSLDSSGYFCSLVSQSAENLA
jgi:hypothetical protein